MLGRQREKLLCLFAYRGRLSNRANLVPEPTAAVVAGVE
jgi:hypothetical protein